MIFCCLGTSIRVVMLLRDVKTQVKKRKCCIREEEKILKDLEAPALGLWIPALRPAPPARWVVILPKNPIHKKIHLILYFFCSQVRVFKSCVTSCGKRCSNK